MTNNKYKKLALSLVFDAVGMISYAFPGFGEITDIAWAPLSAWLMTKMYKGNVGKAGAVFSFIEEAMPGLDIIPTFSIMWIYTYLIKNEETEEIIDVS